MEHLSGRVLQKIQRHLWCLYKVSDSLYAEMTRTHLQVEPVKEGHRVKDLVLGTFRNRTGQSEGGVGPGGLSNQQLLWGVKAERPPEN